jgi:phosphatidylethanolamine/phosphatidyl-N-methylethanolamine N-methyltransferase
MPNWLHDQRVFWRQFRQQFHTTGAVLPSGRFLARALARYVGQQPAGQRILEIGPGTGAVTSQIVRRLGPHDQLDLVELNDEFVKRLNERFAAEEAFCQVAPRSRVLHCPVEDLHPETRYDLVVSGLPLNNFSVADVEHLLASITGLLRPGGRLSFFEYIAIRPARALVSGRAERARLHGISQALGRLLGPHEVRRDWIWPNVPPAWVHHVQMPGDG